MYLEPEDDGPDEPQGEAMVAVHNVVGAHILQVDSLLLEELQGLVHVLQAVDAHAPLGGLGLEREERYLLLKIYTNVYYSLLTWLMNDGLDSPIKTFQNGLGMVCYG